MNINTRNLSFVNFNGQEMQWVKFNGVTVYEAWKELTKNGVPPLTFYSKGEDLIDYKIYGNTVQDGVPTVQTPIEYYSVGDESENIFDYQSTPLLNENEYYQPLEILAENNSLVLKTRKTNAIQRAEYFMYVGKGNEVTITIPELSLGAGSNFSNSRVSYRFSDSIEFSQSGHSTLFSFYNLSADTNYSVTKTYTATGDYLVFSPQVHKGSDYTTSILTMKDIEIKINDGKYKIPIKITNENGYSLTTNIYLNEPLRKINKAQDYKDYIDFTNKIVHREIVELNLNGSESWVLGSGNNSNGQIMFIRIPNKRAYTLDMYCNRAPVVINSVANPVGDGFRLFHGGGAGEIYFFVPYTIAETITEFKEWLSNNNTQVLYAVTTAGITTEEIQLPNISTNKGNCIFEIDTNVLPSNAEVTYIGK